jgi:hypothetical protein
MTLLLREIVSSYLAQNGLTTYGAVVHNASGAHCAHKQVSTGCADNGAQVRAAYQAHIILRHFKNLRYHLDIIVIPIDKHNISPTYPVKRFFVTCVNESDGATRHAVLSARDSKTSGKLTAGVGGVALLCQFHAEPSSFSDTHQSHPLIINHSNGIHTAYVLFFAFLHPTPSSTAPHATQTRPLVALL